MHNPATLVGTGAFGSLPMRLYYGTTDVVAVPGEVTAFATAMGPSCSAIPLAGGHQETTIGQINTASVVSFFSG